METLIENKFNKYIASPEGFWNDCLENRRKLTYDEQQQYQNLCEVYSDIYSYFMCKKAFTIMEVKGLLRQYKYFNMVAEEFEKPLASYIYPTYILKEIQSMRRNLARYFEQFETIREDFRC